VIEMFRHLAALEPDCTLSFIGPDWGIFLPDGKMQGSRRISRRCPKVSASGSRCWASAARPEIAALRRRHGITVIASRYETFGYVMAEAMAIGSPIVCTQVGGPAEILKHEETALLVPPEDPEALADACKRLIDDPALAIRLGHAAHEYATRHLSPAVVGRQMADFLECVVNSSSR
jgi:glycosyltransferase involved in cell wall biosynthesis